jgi:cell wall-associated NlpC family hydrolase
VSSHLRIARTAVVLLPFAASCSQNTGTISQAGRSVPVPAPSRTAAAVIPTAEHYIGVPYKWGGTTPKGFDCSGLVQYVFEKHGVGLPRTSRAQALVGSRVPLTFTDLRAGDLIMFASRGEAISHVAIYAGNRRIIHSSKSGAGVRYDDLTSQRGAWFKQNAVVARRVATAGQGQRIVRDFAAELRQSGVRVDFPLIADVIGDRAPRP